MEGSTLTNSRGALARFTAVSAAAVAALAVGGAPVPAAAAPQVAAAFPTGTFLIKNPAQQAKCVTPKLPSYLGALTLRTCGTIEQDFTAFNDGGYTELIPLWSDTSAGTIKCLSANSANEVYTAVCDGATNRQWQLVGRTVKNRATGKCLSANSANQVYTAICDGAINRNWTFPSPIGVAGTEAARTVSEARRAELTRAGLAGGR
jgi:Ricin-type beta-trefoil lectin domain